MSDYEHRTHPGPTTRFGTTGDPARGTVRCDFCPALFTPRPLGDLADLNNACRGCAEQLAAQLALDYNDGLDWASDEDRHAAVSGEPPVHADDHDTSVYYDRCRACRASIPGMFRRTPSA